MVCTLTRCVLVCFDYRNFFFILAFNPLLFLSPSFKSTIIIAFGQMGRLQHQMEGCSIVHPGLPPFLSWLNRSYSYLYPFIPYMKHSSTGSMAVWLAWLQCTTIVYYSFLATKAIHFTALTIFYPSYFCPANYIHLHKYPACIIILFYFICSIFYSYLSCIGCTILLHSHSPSLSLRECVCVCALHIICRTVMRMQYWNGNFKGW